MTLFIVALLMFVVAIVFSMLGQGGGVLYTPIQDWAGIDFHQAAATSLFLIMVVSLSASLVFRKAKKIDWPLTAVLESVTVVGGFLGGVYSAKVSGDVLRVLFAVVIAVAGVLMVRPPAQKSPTVGNWLNKFSWRRSLGDKIYHVNLALGLPVSFLAGLASGMVGVGGGILKVPIMVLLLGVPLDIAIGCSAIMIGITAAAGFGGHVASGHWDWKTSLILAAAVFVGGQIGSRISIRLDKRKLKLAFGWFLLVIAVMMTVTSLVQIWHSVSSTST